MKERNSNQDQKCSPMPSLNLKEQTMRLIDADKLWKTTEYAYGNVYRYYEAWEVDEAPTIDAVEVVRCKDCKYNIGEVNKKGFLICSANGMDITGDDYCSWGERMEEKFDRHNFYWACHFSRRYHRLKNKERWQDRISKIRNEPIKSGTDLNDITEWGVYEVNDETN